LFFGELFERAGGDRAAAALRAAAIAGALTPSLGREVSAVAAPLLARERGIEVLEAREPRDRDFRHRVALELTAEAGRRLRVDGTCFGRQPRLVSFDGLPLDAGLEGDLIVTRHHDRPGMVGKVGTLLGDRGINLDSVEVGSLPHSGPQSVAVAIL